MPRLEDYRDGSAPLTDQTTISYNGEIYRGRKAILALADRILPVREDTPEKVIEDERAIDSEPAASEPAKRRKRRAKKEDTSDK